MAGFYGNIRNATSNSFKFDRVYSNRALMDKNAEADGVFGGRYVLVEYDQGLTENFINPISQTYYKFNGKYYLNSAIIKPETEEIEIVDEEIIEPEDNENSEIQDGDDDTPVEPAEDDEEEVPSTQTRTINSFSLTNIEDDTGVDMPQYDPKCLLMEIIEQTIAIDYTDTYYEKIDDYYYNKNDELYYDEPYQFDDSKNLILNTSIHGELYNDEGQIEAIQDLSYEDNYTINYAIDKVIYGNGRGYDSTVWRKVYLQDGRAKYVNIAELNSVVPTFAVSGDAPNDTPTPAHFDKDSTNVYYNLHLQSPWGFRIGEAKTNTKLESRETDWMQDYSSHSLVNYDDKSDVTIHSYKIERDDSGRTIHEPVEYDGAIFFNKDGFDKIISTHSDADDYVAIDSTGVSGELYNNHLDTTHLNNKTKWEDTKELRVILPTLGNAIATVWDKLWGAGENNNNKRTPYIGWFDPNYPPVEDRLHLVTDKNDGYYYSPDGYPLYPKENQEKDEIDTLAGAINSVHDLMGMIITGEEPPIIEPGDGNDFYKIEGDDTVYIPGASTKFIYYSKDGEDEDETHEFYYAGNGYGYEQLSDDEVSYNWLGVGSGNEYSGYVKIPSDRLKDYKNINPKQYIKESATVWKRDDADIASANTSYYELPEKIRYIGNLMDPTKQNRYYVLENVETRYVDNQNPPVTHTGSVLGYALTDDYSDKSKSYYSIHGTSTGIGAMYEVKKTEEPYFDDIVYYIYDEDRDRYVELTNEDIKWGNSQKKWSQLTLEERKQEWTAATVYRQGVFNGNTYNVFDSEYYNFKEIFVKVDQNNKPIIKKQNNYYLYDEYDNDTINKFYHSAPKMIQINGAQINNLYDLMTHIDSLNAEREADPTMLVEETIDGINYKWIKLIDNRCLYGEIGKRIEPGLDGEYKEVTVYKGFWIKSFLFDNNNLYELLTESQINDLAVDSDKVYFIKSGFTRPSGLKPFSFDGADDNQTVQRTNVEKPTFYKISPKEAKYYEPNRYFIFSSDNTDISEKDKWNNIDHRVYITREDYPEMFSDGDDSTKQLWDVQNADISSLVINTADQDIKKFQLSTGDYIAGITYWSIENDDNGNKTSYWKYYDPEEDEIEFDPYYKWTGEGDPLKDYIVAHGADDFNVGIPEYFKTKDTEKDANKTYYVEQNGVYSEYEGNFPAAEDVIVYEKNPEYPEVLYYTDNVFYVNLGDDVYEIASVENGYRFNENNNDLYKQRQLYIINVGNFTDKFNLYQKWNLNLIRSQEDFDFYFSEQLNPYRYVQTFDEEYQDYKDYYILDNEQYVLFDGDEFTEGETYYERYGGPIVLGKRINTLVKRVLPGFARDINTIHGLLIRINEILQSGDTKTRDTNTVQGCINSMRDILEIFRDLIPGELYGVDMYGKLSPIGISGIDPDTNEGWLDIEAKHDLDIDQTIIYITHNTTDEFNNFIEYEGAIPAAQGVVVYELDGDTYVPTEDTSRNNEKTYYVKEKQDLIDNLVEAKEDNGAQKVHDVFGFNDSTRLILDSPVIDNAGHVVGSEPSHVYLADLLLETNDNNTTIGTLNSPSGSISITSNDILRDALNKIITHINAGADNITLTNYNNYYINDVNASMGDDVDNNDNLAEAIAKLQWQLNHIANRPLTDLDSVNNRGTNTPIAATDTLGQGLNKLQAQINSINNQTIEGAGNGNGIINNYCGIIRSDPDHIPTNLSEGYFDDEMSVPALKSGWIWVCHTDAIAESGTQGEEDYVAPQPEKNYVYIKIKNGIKAENFVDNIDRNYWELINAWQ